ncbi:gamma-glutamyltransferase [Ferrovibrio sp.]|uniref:gamma-glutamyltransferase n=1 Tax=Ferrovibrio sp. TaxID=1917215 RepID=UPI003D2E562C
MMNSSPNRLVVSCQPQKGRQRAGLRQCTAPSLALVLALLVLAGCGKKAAEASDPTPEAAKGFTGVVTSDEPRATLVARNILAAGGSAADAVAAGTLAMAVTYPTAVSLGAGGLCVAVDPARKRADTIEFLPRLPAGGGAVPIPGLLRGLAMLQGVYGTLRWEAVVSPAEALARFGERTSRAFVQSVQEANPPALGDPALGRLLAGPGGRPRAEGDLLVQNELAFVLGRVRSAGPTDFYQGQVARQIVADSARIGGAISEDDLRGFAAQVTKPIELPFQYAMTIYASPNARGGATAAWLVEQGFSPASTFSIQSVGSAKPRDFATSIGQAYRGLEGNAPLFEHGSASISAIDKDGRAVSCAIGLGRAFGSRRIGSETGILFAATPGIAGDETPFLAAMVAANYTAKQSFAAGAVSGGAPGPAALAQVMIEAFTGKQRINQVIARPRLFQPGPQAPVMHEAGVDAAMLGAITQRGVPAVEVRRLGRVTMAVCSNGVPRSPETCRGGADPRGFGLSAGDEF